MRRRLVRLGPWHQFKLLFKKILSLILNELLPTLAIRSIFLFLACFEVQTVKLPVNLAANRALAKERVAYNPSTIG